MLVLRSREPGTLAGKGLRSGTPAGRDVTGTLTAAFGLSHFFGSVVFSCSELSQSLVVSLLSECGSGLRVPLPG